MAVIRSFDIKRLKPFHREGDRMPKPAPEKTDEVAALDPDLRPDEQSYVNHYLNYADALLQTDEGDAAAPKPLASNIIDLPTIEQPAQPLYGEIEPDPKIPDNGLPSAENRVIESPGHPVTGHRKASKERSIESDKSDSTGKKEHKQNHSAA